MRDYDPGMGLNFTLQSYKWMGDSVVMSGTVSNSGNRIWSGAVLEFEVFADDNIIVAECGEFIGELKPGEWESLISKCSVIEDYQRDAVPSEVSFHLKRSFKGPIVVE